MIGHIAWHSNKSVHRVQIDWLPLTFPKMLILLKRAPNTWYVVFVNKSDKCSTELTFKQISGCCFMKREYSYLMTNIHRSCSIVVYNKAICGWTIQIEVYICFHFKCIQTIDFNAKWKKHPLASVYLNYCVLWFVSVDVPQYSWIYRLSSVACKLYCNM